MKKQRKNNTEKMKNQKISWLAKAVYAAAAIRPESIYSKCHAYYGRISASGILYCMGHCLSAVFSIWISIAEQESGGISRSITLIAIAGAFVFVLSSLEIPSVTGSCSHMTVELVLVQSCLDHVQ